MNGLTDFLQQIQEVQSRKKIMYSPSVDSTCGVINSQVWFVATVVLECVLDGCDAQYEQERQHGHLFTESIDRRHEIQQHNEQEIQVSKPAEWRQKMK